MPIKIPKTIKSSIAKDPSPAFANPDLEDDEALIQHDDDGAPLKTADAVQWDATMAAVAPLIDKLGSMQTAVEKAKQTLKDYATIQRDVTEMVEKATTDFNPDDKFVVTGEKYRMEFGAKGTSREIIDMDGVRAIMGNDLFMQLATVKLKDIDDYLTPQQKDTVIATHRTGRSTKLVKQKS